jgi:predicted nucleotide-binding protein (sugar kinase/HSP70/actin superfamily)
MNDSMEVKEPGCVVASRAVARIEADLRSFETEETRRLGLDAATEHWHAPDPLPFTEEQRADTTVLFGGLTVLHDALLEAIMSRFGHSVQALDCPDTEALQTGKEFGNRGQCNPTYFTVGNLVKYLIRLRDEEGMETEDIIDKYVFVTAGACGPCRFGTYMTEYRKALKDAGFKGFRVLDIRKFGEHKRNPNVSGLKFDLPFNITTYKTLLAADVINALGYRIRPYEVVPGTTDEALATCRNILTDAIKGKRSTLLALRRCRNVLEQVEVDRLVPKPKVSIIGEFWAMTTEGDGNYRLQRFLESEGAECDIQLLTAWLLYEVWEVQYDTRERMALRRHGGRKHESESDSPVLTLSVCWLISCVARLCFAAFARAAGLKHYHLPDMEHIARISKEMYPNELRGGEGHMEVGKVIDAVSKNKVHMVVSVKPFGCMPSSGVSDGIQSLVAAKYPDANFCPIETSGDGAVGIYSRVQMALFKARARAKDEFNRALAANGLDNPATLQKIKAGARLRSALYYPRHKVAGTAANAVFELSSGHLNMPN